MRIDHTSFLVAIVAGVVSLCASLRTMAAERPHIVVVVLDDLGNADLGYRGSPIRTPHIDALAHGGARLESYYGLPLCTPARAALMTGRHPMRHGLQTLVIFPSHRYGLPTDETTLPEALRSAGYRTLMCGKWHLGHAEPPQRDLYSVRACLFPREPLAGMGFQPVCADHRCRLGHFGLALCGGCLCGLDDYLCHLESHGADLAPSHNARRIALKPAFWLADGHIRFHGRHRHGGQRL